MKKDMISFAFALLLTAGMMLSGCGKKADAPNCRIDFAGEPKGAEIFYNGKSVGKVPAAVGVRTGRYVFKAVAPGYESAYMVVNFLEPGARKVEVSLAPVTASVLLSSRPSGAKVYIGDELKGVTPLVMNWLRPGKYKARFEQSGFAPRAVEWTMTDERPKEVMVTLDSNVGRVSIATEPSGAKVFVGDKLRGVTPYRGEWDEGRYDVRFEKEGYLSQKESMLVKRDQDNEASFKLMPVPGTLTITSSPPGAAVFQGDAAMGVTPLTIREIVPGEYTFRVVKDGYEPASKSVSVAGGGNNDLDFVLELNTGGIDLDIRPAGATVFLNDREMGKVKPGESRHLTEKFSIRNLTPGEYTVSVHHRRGVPDRVVRKLTVRRNRIERPEPIVLWVANAEIKNRREGRVEIGVLYSEGEKKITFGPQPGVKIDYDKSDIEYIKMLDNE